MFLNHKSNNVISPFFNVGKEGQLPIYHFSSPPTLENDWWKGPTLSLRYLVFMKLVFIIMKSLRIYILKKEAQVLRFKLAKDWLLLSANGGGDLTVTVFFISNIIFILMSWLQNPKSLKSSFNSLTLPYVFYWIALWKTQVFSNIHLALQQ